MFPAGTRDYFLCGWAIVFAVFAIIPCRGALAWRGQIEWAASGESKVSGRCVLSNTEDKQLAIKCVSASCSNVRVMGFTNKVSPKGTGTVFIEMPLVQDGGIDLLVETDSSVDPVLAIHWPGLRAEDTAGAPVAAAPLGEKLFISPAEVWSLREAPGLMLVDVRESAEFNECHVEGAVNSLIRMIERMASLKNRKLILIGRGSDDHSLAGDALGLESAGFDSVRILHGGLRAWRQAGLPVRSVGTSAGRTARLSAWDFFGTREDEWLIVHFTSRLDSHDEIPQALRLNFAGPWKEQFALVIRSEAAKRSAPFRVLAISDGGEEYENIEKALPAEPPALLFFLEGGLRGFRQVAGERWAALGRREGRLTAGGGATSGFRTVLGECSSCPKKYTAIQPPR